MPQQKDPVTGTSSDWLKMPVDPEVRHPNISLMVDQEAHFIILYLAILPLHVGSFKNRLSLLLHFPFPMDLLPLNDQFQIIICEFFNLNGCTGD